MPHRPGGLEWAPAHRQPDELAKNPVFLDPTVSGYEAVAPGFSYGLEFASDGSVLPEEVALDASAQKAEARGNAQEQVVLHLADVLAAAQLHTAAAVDSEEIVPVEPQAVDVGPSVRPRRDSFDEILEVCLRARAAVCVC
jgi:hypothetical protein